jgi:hypothetical protein
MSNVISELGIFSANGFNAFGAGALSAAAAACGFADAGPFEVELAPFSCCACAHPVDRIPDNNATMTHPQDDDDD